MRKKLEDMKHFRSVFLVLSFFLIVKTVYGGFEFYEESVSIGSTGTVGKLLKKDERIPIVSTEFGEISSMDIDDGVGSGMHSYHLQFITLEPNSLFLPVLLHADMIFYVQTGSGKVSWTDSDELYKVSLKRGDIYRLKSGTLFYLHSSLESERPRLRIIAIFANPKEEQLQGPSIGPYSSINDLVRGFDKRVLQAAFQVPEEVIEELTSAIDTPAIVHAEPKKKSFWQEEVRFINAFLGIQGYSKQFSENKKKHTKTFNFFKEDPNFENCNGWSTVVTEHDLDALHGSQIGAFMVNITKGSMMGPHWNPMATEVSVVLEGEGMVRVVCPSTLTKKECKHSRFRIEEGDVFTVPRFHPMAQTSFNNGSLVIMGFSTTTKKNHPQFLAGKASVLQTISKPILSASFNVSNTTIDELLDAQDKAIILDCTSCAEEQEMLMEDEIEKERQEEERRRQEEEARRREEEEERRRREEEEKKKRKEEEEERRREEEEERRRREGEAEKRREEEEERRRREEEEKERGKEEEQRRREEEEEEEQRRREDEERKRKEEEQRRREEEEEKQRRREEEEQRRSEEEEEQTRKEDEERKRKEEEGQKRREEEEQRRREEEEEQRRREDEERKRKEEEKQRRREEEEEQRKRKEEEEQRRREEEQQRRREEEEEQRRREDEERKRKEEEKQRRREEEEQRRREEEEMEIERQREQEEQRRQEEIERQREKEERRRQEEERRKQEEQQCRQEEERQRQEEERRRHGEEESEQEIARREEEERREWQRQAEEPERKKREQEEGFLRHTAKVN